MNQSAMSQKKPLPPPRAAPPLSFAEQIAAASSKLKKASDITPQPKKVDLPTNPLNQRRVSTMDALKEQIMLRKQSMNPNSLKKDGESAGDLAKKAMLASKFNTDSFDEEENEESSDSGFEAD